MFGHKQIWAAIEAVAESCGMSLSALSKSAGLDATSFNPSKRYHGSRERWPSTETLSKILKVANMDMRTFADILDAQSENGSEKRPPSRRRSKRFPTILEGYIRLQAPTMPIPCRIRDLSASGARIRLPASVVLPGEFELEIPGLRQSVKASLVWRQPNACGVMFLEELRHPSDGDGTGLLAVLQTSDDEKVREASPERLAPPSQDTPRKRARSRRKQPRLMPRKSV